MSKYRIIHKTTYTSQEPVSVGHNEARIQPRSFPHQHVINYRLECHPNASCMSHRTDYFGNHVSAFSFNQGYQSLEVIGASYVDVLSRGLHSKLEEWSQHGPTWRDVRDRLQSGVHSSDLEASEFVFDSPRIHTSTALAAYGHPSMEAHATILGAALDLTKRIHKDFTYQQGSTHISTPLSEVLTTRRGVCQDFAHLQIGALRSLGLAARYVSGYLRTIPPPGQPRLVGADASHAWVSVYCGELGWIDLDPTNNCLVDTDHITLAYGRDYGDVPPLRGVFIGGLQSYLTVSVDVCPVN